MAKFSVQEVIELVRSASAPAAEEHKKKGVLYKYGFVYRERGYTGIYVSTGDTREGEVSWRASMIEKKDKIVLSEVFPIEVPDTIHADAQREKAEMDAEKASNAV